MYFISILVLIMFFYDWSVSKQNYNLLLDCFIQGFICRGLVETRFLNLFRFESKLQDLKIWKLGQSTD